MSKKSIKDYFDVAQVESHGPNHADDNPPKQVHVWRCINKNFARNLLLANGCSIFFSVTNFYKKGASPCAGKYSCTSSKKNVLKAFFDITFYCKQSCKLTVMY